MKIKKAMAIVLSIGLIISSFNGIITSYAKNSDNEPEGEIEQDFSSSLPPMQNITELEQEVLVEDIPAASITESSTDSQVIYKGTKITANSQYSTTGDLYNIGQQEIEEYMKNGYTIQDIFMADEIANNIGVEPKYILDKKINSDITFDEIKEDILKEKKDKKIVYYKNKYQKEFERLTSEKFGQDETLLLLSYIETNKLDLTNDIIKEYKDKGEELFKTSKKTSLSKEAKKKYGISDKEAECISNETLIALEAISNKTDRPIKDVIKSYLKKIKK